jgi:hypothetical protein
MASVRIRLLYGVLQLLFLSQAVLADTLTVTISDYPGFLSQRKCAENCFIYGYSFGCPTSPLENSCYCRRDLISSAAKSVSSCVSNACSGNSVDVQSATNIYIGYCSQNGYVAATPTAGAEGNGGKVPDLTSVDPESTPVSNVVA